MKIFEKLLAVQVELKAPKGQFNEFGKYKYRSCEDILEAVKPLLKRHGTTVYITDEVKVIGERYYIQATVNFVDIESGEKITTTAYAREEESKKGMDGSQITGASSSYARKYALNGMFDIDDARDSDVTNTHGKDETEKVRKAKEAGIKPETKELMEENSAAFDRMFGGGEKEETVCPICGKKIESATGKNGKTWTPGAILKRYGMCKECYEAQLKGGGK